MRSAVRPGHLVRTIAAICILAAVHQAARVRADSLSPEELVFVTEDLAVRHPGCDAISVFSPATGEILHGGETQTSPGRLAVSADRRTVVASWNNLGPAGKYLMYVLRSVDADLGHWGFGGLVYGETDHPASPLGGVAVLADGDAVLIATASTRDPRGNGCTLGCAPYRVRKYLLSEVEYEQGGQTGRIGDSLGSVDVPGIAGEILADPVSDVVHVVTDIPTTVVTLDPATMRRAAADIQLAPLVDRPDYGPGSAAAWLHADITADGRYLMANRIEEYELSVADLDERTSWTAPMPVNPADRGFVLGVSVSECTAAAYCVAVHRLDKVSVFTFDPRAGLSFLAEAAVPSPYPVRELLASEIDDPLPGPSLAYGPIGSIEWAGGGTRLIAAASYGIHDFVVLELDAPGRELRQVEFLTACPMSRNFPNDIVVVPKAPQAPRTPTATATGTDEPTRTTTPTGTPTAARRPTPTTHPTPAPLYLPIAIRESCNPVRERSDIALVIDTSSSMAGRKLAGAKTAALSFVGLIDLEPGRSQVAVVRYDRAADVVQQLTRSRTLIDAAIRSLRVRSGTHIDKGLRAALGELQSGRHLDRNLPVMILLTDGLQTGTPGEELRAAAEVRDEGVRLYTIGLGSDVDETALKTMAGDESRYYYAPDSSDLARIYSEIAQDLMCPGKEFWGGR